MQKLRLYHYDQADLGLEPDFTYRPAPVLAQPDPAHFERATNPADADFIVFPVLLSDIGASHKEDPDYLPRFLPSLRWFRAHEAKHVFFLPGVDTWAPLFCKSVFFRTSVHRDFPDLNAVATPHYESALNFAYHPDPKDLVYHTSFVGFPGSWPGRVELVKALSQVQGLNCYWRISGGFHGHLTPEEQQRNAQAYEESLTRSVTVLCPRGAGLNSIRFFEALAMGRIPVLISDFCTLPMETEIDYDRFIVRVPEKEVGRIGEILSDWFQRTPPEEIAAKCVVARAAWEKHLSPAQQSSFVIHHLQKIQAANYELNRRQAAAVAELARHCAALRQPG